MHTLIKTLYVFLLSINLNAMEPSPWVNNLSKEIFFCIGNPKIFVKLACTCKAWNEIVSDEAFWKQAYCIKRGTNAKFNETASYKLNCLGGLFACLIKDTQMREVPLQNQDLIFKDEYRISNNASDLQTLLSLENALAKKPDVLCSDAFLFHEHMELRNEFLGCLEKTIADDVLVVISVANGGMVRKKIGEKNLHEAYPNIIWAAANNSNNEFLVQVDDFLADIAMPCDGTTFFTIELGSHLSNLRLLNPELSASKIRLLIRESSKDGLFNYEGAKKAVFECGL